MKKALGGLILVFALLATIGAGCSSSDHQGNNQVNSDERAVSGEIILVVDYGDGNTEEFNFNQTGEISVLDLLQKGNKEKNLGVIVSSDGLIEAIGSKANGDNNKYWMFYVNGAMSEVGIADKYVVAGDRVELKYSSF